jgi:ABC-type transporter Mla MlaB component
VHDDDVAFDEAVRRFLAGGLARGERLLCVGDRAIAALPGDAGVLDVDRLLTDGRLTTLTVAEAYAAAGPFSAETQRRYYDTETRRALDDGFTGLRVVAEISDLAADPGHAEELGRWEQVADEFMASGSGMSAMCAYRSDVPAPALARIAAVHPAVRAPEDLVPFRAYVVDGRLTLVGEVDTFSADRLATVLATAPVGRELDVDVSALRFVDVAGCRVLARWARGLTAGGASVRLRGASGLLRRMWQLLALDDLAPVTFSTT